MEHKYNYVIFNCPETKGLRMDNPDGYYSICLEDLKQISNVMVINYPMENRNIFLKFIYKLVAFLRFRTKQSKWSVYLMRLLYPLYYPKLLKNDKEYCFVFISYIWDIKFVYYLKNKYPNCKIVMALRDLVKTKTFYPELRDSGLIDLWMSYDEGDCSEYNMKYFSEFESKIKVSNDPSIQSSDVFFTGRAKQRLPQLIECYDHLSSLGLNCLFIILDAPENQKVEREGIIYTNTYMSYRKMLEYSIRSRCLLDVNQEGATGYTSRFLEAVIYNKLLISNTLGIKGHSLYDARYIKVFNDIKEVDKSFFDTKKTVEFNYNNEFSPVAFLEVLNNSL